MKSAYNPSLDSFSVTRVGEVYNLSKIIIHSSTGFKLLKAKLVVEFLKEGKPVLLEILEEGDCLSLITSKLTREDRTKLTDMLFKLADYFSSSSLYIAASSL